ncbi:MAG TPA: PAS domain-containing sensor histidine kinase [Usitatibacter sp.]|nr:PAS domain-containing sensor histidine kinase [Usitatibacter sp.]
MTTPPIEPTLASLPLSRLADSGVVGMVLWDTSGKIHEANDRFLEVLGYDRTDLDARAMDWARLTPESRRKEVPAAIARLERERIVRAEDRELVRKDGAAVFVRLHSTRLGGSDKALSVLVDITDAEAAVRSRDDVLAIVSHDLRNPLSVIAMSAKLLESPLPEAKRLAQVGIIRRAVSGMNRLIADLLDVTQITSGRLSIDPAPLEVRAICEDARLMFASLLEAKHQEFRCSADPGAGSVLADRDRIAQVLANLVGNAHKFTPEGGRIEMRAEAMPDGVRFVVNDSGPGLAAEDLPHVFDRFWQARKVRRGGVGLGLPITKGIVDAHGGRIWVESSAGVGTTFYFTLPLAPRSPPLAG